MRKIFIIEDNKKIRDELTVFLSKNGYTCESCDDMRDIADTVLTSKAHLLLLDLNLPVTDGFYICKEIRKKSDMPVIVVTSRDSEIDELLAMNFGADDYVTKPFNTQILLLRIAAVLKRAYKETSNDILDFGKFNLIPSKSIIEFEQGIIELTKNELKILTCLYDHKDGIVSRDELMTQLWNSDMFVDDNTLTVNINRLRKKLDDAGLSGIIETKRGLGYLLK
jgi:DNA-binding response OmpR family regulator